MSQRRRPTADLLQVKVTPPRWGTIFAASSRCRLRADTQVKESSMNQLRVNNLFDLDPFDDAWRGFLRPWKFEPVSQAPKIKLDITEHDDSYALKAEIPGVRKEDIDVRIEGNQVTISAEIKKDKEEKK